MILVETLLRFLIGIHEMILEQFKEKKKVKQTKSKTRGSYFRLKNYKIGEIKIAQDYGQNQLIIKTDSEALKHSIIYKYSYISK